MTFFWQTYGVVGLAFAVAFFLIGVVSGELKESLRVGVNTPMDVVIVTFASICGWPVFLCVLWWLSNDDDGPWSR